MDHRELVRIGVAAGAARAQAVSPAAPLMARPAAPPAARSGALPVARPSAPGILDAGLSEQQQLMEAGKLTAHALTSQYLARIQTYNHARSPHNARIEINPEALKLALEMDRERQFKRVRGPLHGIPVLLGDHIATADRMSTSAGWAALGGVRATRDADLAARLRAAGAVLIGKAKCHPRSALAAHPLAVGTPGGGANAGAAAALAAGLATLAVRTERGAGLNAVPVACALVGIQPTPGLLSHAGILPLPPGWQVTGPLARNVSDAALILAAMVATTARAAVTPEAAGQLGDYSAALTTGGLAGRRLGVLWPGLVYHDESTELLAQARQQLSAQGATLIETALPPVGHDGACASGLRTRFTAELAAYLSDYAPQVPPSAMAEMLSAAGLHGAAQDVPVTTTDAIAQLMQAQQLDALVLPAAGAAWANACPQVTLRGVSFVGAAHSEALLIRMAYSYEQALRQNASSGQR